MPAPFSQYHGLLLMRRQPPQFDDVRRVLARAFYACHQAGVIGCKTQTIHIASLDLPAICDERQRLHVIDEQFKAFLASLASCSQALAVAAERQAGGPKRAPGGVFQRAD